MELKSLLRPMNYAFLAFCYTLYWKMKKIINKREFLKKYKDLKSISSWTKEKHNKKERLLSYILLHQHKNFNINLSKNTFGFSWKSWEYKLYSVPENKKGNLSDYRGLKVILLNKGPINQFKLEIFAIPYTL